MVNWPCEELLNDFEMSEYFRKPTTRNQIKNTGEIEKAYRPIFFWLACKLIRSTGCDSTRLVSELKTAKGKNAVAQDQS